MITQKKIITADTKNAMSPLLTLSEAAKLLGIHTETLRHYAAEGRVPAAKLGKYWRFIEADLVNYLRSLYDNNASQGVIDHRRKTIWHSTKEKAFGGSTSATKAKEYAAALKPLSKRKQNGCMTS